MKISVSKEKFIRRSNLKHNYKYDYSLVDYVNTNTKVIIICKEHGQFTQRPNAHFNGQGCRKCNQSRPNNLSKIDFINRSNEYHKGKYNYDLVNYTNSSDKVTIICPKHGEFKQNAYLHYTGLGCRKCSSENRKGKHKSFFIQKANKKHGNKYDYSLLPEYLFSKETVTIICQKGHHFKQTMKDHIGSGNGRSNGCKYCSMPCSDTESFIRLSNERHGNKYDYSKVEYKTQKDKVIITCKIHGDFIQKATNHLHLGRGCRRCGESKGELEIRKWLEEKNIHFEKEKTFKNCENRRLRFDFYLPEYNTCIEFDGLQHFKSIQQFGGEKEFEKTKQRDITKNKYYKEVGINLIRVNYIDLQKGYIPSILNAHFSLQTL